MRRGIFLAMAVLATLALATSAAWAGSPHFVGEVIVERIDDSLVVSGKEAGLGGEDQVEIQITATAQCINPGGNKPKAANKQSLSDADTFPVQNGKAEFELTLTATFQPECTPPMTVEFSDVTVTDLTNDITVSFGGTF